MEVKLDPVGSRENESSSPVKTTLTVRAICCASEVPIVHRCLDDLPGVSSVVVNVPLKTCYVYHLPRKTHPKQLEAKLNQAGLGARIKEKQQFTVKPKKSWKDSMPKWNVTAAFVIWVLSFLKFVRGIPPYFQYLALLALVLIIPPIIRRAFGSLWNCPPMLDINCLMVIAGLGAVLIGDISEGATVVVLFGLSDWLESIATLRVREAIQSIIDLRPETAILAKSRKTIPVESVKVGMDLEASPGDKIPVDGLVSRGVGFIDQSMLTGESVPVRVKTGDRISGGCLLVNGSIEFEAVATADNSAVSKLVALVEQAQAQRSPTEQMINYIAKYYTPTVVLAATGLAVFPLVLGYGAQASKDGIRQALILLVTACPCALLISTPICYVCGLAAAAHSHVLIKGGEHLESLAQVVHMAFDKTGTLTKGSFNVTRFEITTKFFSKDRQRLVMEALIALESKSNHPIANALILYAKTSLESLPEAKESLGSQEADEGGEQKFTVLEGEGIAGTYAGQQVFVGRPGPRRCAGLLDTIPREIRSKAKAWEAEGRTVGHVFIENEVAASYAVSDELRENASSVVQRFTNELNVDLTMLTGDSQGPARAIAGALAGTIDVRANLLPKDKIGLVTSIRERSRSESQCCCSCARGGMLAMVGDGINDAPALAAADVGIAMGAQGTAMAMEVADVVLMDSDLDRLVWVVHLARALMRKIIVNVTIAMVAKLLMIILVAFKLANLWMAIVADVGSMLLVTVNATFLLQWEYNAKDPSLSECIRNKGRNGFSYSSYGTFGEENERNGTGACTKGCCAEDSYGKQGIEASTRSTVQSYSKDQKTNCTKGCCGTEVSASMRDDPVSIQDIENGHNGDEEINFDNLVDHLFE
eukprot:CAMPEP_0184491438 /NCGR_PEP_ID=MMETSP0113_2-20130426/20386_1 /TAXON_ID=91329 /ORGANISM="Norrisiella sphaerica, Strain BC52" /LENGTH=874 /DNA_ID=CAMNT_0026875807 /DNA_START=76 /DNA_END=2700 /DNA_ORIENTATION=-